MSRQIDTSDLSKLSEDDLKYLRDRGRLTPDQERELLGGINAEPPTARSVEDTPHTGTVDVNGTTPNTASGKPDNANTLVGASGQELPENYEDWTKEQLQNELRSRDLSTSGNKDELISRLAEDDAEGEED